MHGPSLLDRIYRLKLLALGACLIVAGLALSAFGDWLEGRVVAHLLVSVTQNLADVLVVTGGIGLAIDFFTGRDRAAAEIERTRGVVRELVPDFTDAVLRGLAVGREDLRRVATPKLLDDIATNALALRLGDEQFAAEIYDGLLAQAIRTPERWEDVDVNVRLSCIDETTAGDLDPQVLYSAVVTWS